MRIFKNTWFSKFARKEKISDKELIIISGQLENGQYDADLGGNVYKVRQSRPGKGKRSGYRVIVLFKSSFRTVYVYGFSKSDKDNINEEELRIIKNRAKDTFLLTEEQINERIKNGTLVEIIQEAGNEKI